MKEIRCKIKCETGLHARPAAMLVSAAVKFKSSVMIQKGEKTANLKSLLSLLSLGIRQNDEIGIRVDGVDEAETLDIILGLIDSFES